jgi:hypothetical protein
MKSKYIVLILIGLIVNSFSSPEAVSQISRNEGEIFEKVFTIDGDDLEKEFLLAYPNNISITNKNDIILVDESKIKVFSDTGKEISTYYGPGQGPGEIIEYGHSYYSHNNFLSVIVDGGNTFQIYDSNYGFVKKYNMRNYDPIIKLKKLYECKFLLLEGVFIFNENIRVLQVNMVGIRNDNKPFENIKLGIIIDTPDGTEFIVDYLPESVFNVGRWSAEVPFCGDLLCDITEENKIVYTHTRIDVNENFEYAINIYDLNNKEKRMIVRKYDPEKIDESEKKRFINPETSKKYNVPPELDEFIYDRLKNTIYHPSLQQIYVDGSLLYALTFKKTDNNNFCMDIFDIKDEEFLYSAEISFIPNLIRKGRAYKINRQRDQIPTVDVYKLKGN